LGQSAGIHGILKGPRNVILTDNLGKGLRTIFSGKNSVTHARTLKLTGHAIQQDFTTKDKILKNHPFVTN